MTWQKYINKVGNATKVGMEGSIQSLIHPYTSVQCRANRCRDGALYTTFTLTSSLPCLHTFWHAVLTSSCIFILVCVPFGLQPLSVYYSRTV